MIWSSRWVCSVNQSRNQPAALQSPLRNLISAQRKDHQPHSLQPREHEVISPLIGALETVCGDWKLCLTEISHIHTPKTSYAWQRNTVPRQFVVSEVLLFHPEHTVIFNIRVCCPVNHELVVVVLVIAHLDSPFFGDWLYECWWMHA